MRAIILSADADGVIRNAGGEGVGFALLPAVGGPASSDADTRPGAFPVSVEFLDRGERKEVTAPDAFFTEPFRGFHVHGCQPGDTFLVVVFEDRSEGVSRGRATRALVRVARPTEAPVDPPALRFDGFEVRPNCTRLFIYASAGGPPPGATLWVQSRGGAWYSAGPLLAATPQALSPIGGRVYVQASGPGLLVEIDAEMEVA